MRFDLKNSKCTIGEEIYINLTLDQEKMLVIIDVGIEKDKPKHLAEALYKLFEDIKDDELIDNVFNLVSNINGVNEEFKNVFNNEMYRLLGDKITNISNKRNKTICMVKQALEIVKNNYDDLKEYFDIDLFNASIKPKSEADYIKYFAGTDNLDEIEIKKLKLYDKSNKCYVITSKYGEICVKDKTILNWIDSVYPSLPYYK